MRIWNKPITAKFVWFRVVNLELKQETFFWLLKIWRKQSSISHGRAYQVLARILANLGQTIISYALSNFYRRLGRSGDCFTSQNAILFHSSVPTVGDIIWADYCDNFSYKSANLWHQCSRVWKEVLHCTRAFKMILKCEELIYFTLLKFN